MKGLGRLSDELLVKSYLKALELDLESDFINLLLEELTKRNFERLPESSCSS